MYCKAEMAEPVMSSASGVGGHLCELRQLAGENMICYQNKDQGMMCYRNTCDRTSSE